MTTSPSPERDIVERLAPSELPLSVEAQAACLWLKQRAGHEEEAGKRAADLIARLERRIRDLGELADSTANQCDQLRRDLTAARTDAAEARRAALEEAAIALDQAEYLNASKYVRELQFYGPSK